MSTAKTFGAIDAQTPGNAPREMLQNERGTTMTRPDMTNHPNREFCERIDAQTERRLTVGQLIAELQKYPADAIVLGRPVEDNVRSTELLTRVVPVDCREAHAGEECSWLHDYETFRNPQAANVVQLWFEIPGASIRYFLNSLEPETHEHLARRGGVGEEVVFSEPDDDL
jgi:hypothetical protein